jgi:hypothetical protein
MRKTQSDLLKNQGLMHAVFRRKKQTKAVTNSLKTFNPVYLWIK